MNNIYEDPFPIKGIMSNRLFINYNGKAEWVNPKELRSIQQRREKTRASNKNKHVLKSEL